MTMTMTEFEPPATAEITLVSTPESVSAPQGIQYGLGVIAVIKNGKACYEQAKPIDAYIPDTSNTYLGIPFDVHDYRRAVEFNPVRAIALRQKFESQHARVIDQFNIHATD